MGTRVVFCLYQGLMSSIHLAMSVSVPQMQAGHVLSFLVLALLCSCNLPKAARPSLGLKRAQAEAVQHLADAGKVLRRVAEAA